MRVPDFLTDHHVAFETLVHPPAFTAQRRARLLHVSGAQVAKSVLLVGSQGHVLVVLPATHHVDLEAAAKVLGGPLRLATEDEIAELFRDCEWGTLAPFGTLYGISTTILDEALQPDMTMLFESQSHALSIRLRCCDYEALEKPRRFSFARPTHIRNDRPADSHENA
jgi:Ala-tRNA(Pro) deacylase